MCVDAAPADIVKRPGFKHAMETLDPRYTVPHPSSFSRTVIPKLKQTVDDFHMKRIEEVISKETSIAFSTDGLDCQDSERSAVYSFTLHFYKDDKLCSEVLFVRDLKPPVTGEVVRDFLTDCLHTINALD